MCHSLLSIFYRVASVLLLWGLLIFPLMSGAKTPANQQMIKDITFQDMQNKTHRLAEYRGKWLFINFWAAYCSICRKEIPTLIRFQHHNRGRVQVLGMNYGGETRQKVAEAMRRYRFNYPIIPDQASISRYFTDITGTPTTVVISPQGWVVAKLIGRQSYQELMTYVPSQTDSDRQRIWDGDSSAN